MTSRFPSHFLAYIFCLFAELCSAQTNGANLTFDQLGNLQTQAEDALVNGNPERTISLTDQILTIRPDNFAALFVQALALADLDQNRQAARVAGQAYRVASNEQERLQAARLAGGSHFAANQHTRAEIWLRRASNHLQTERDAEQVVRLFQRARQANPLTTVYDFSLAPTDNVNGGADDNELCYENLDGSCFATFILSENNLALSGAVYTGTARMSYRLAEDQNQSTTVSALVFARSVILSQETKDLLASSPVQEVSALEANDFSSVVGELAFAQRQANLSPLGPTQFSVHLGKFWRASVPVLKYQDFRFGQIVPFGSKSRVSFDLSTRKQQGIVSDLLDARTYEVSGGYATGLANDDVVSFTAFHRSFVADPESSYIEYSGRIDYEFDAQFLNARWSTSAEVGVRKFDEFTTTFDGREDTFASVGIDGIFTEFSYFGFSPSISLRATQTDSDVSFIDSSSVQLRFGIGSNL